LRKINLSGGAFICRRITDYPYGGRFSAGGSLAGKLRAMDKSIGGRPRHQPPGSSGTGIQSRVSLPTKISSLAMISVAQWSISFPFKNSQQTHAVHGFAHISTITNMDFAGDSQPVVLLPGDSQVT
jgi:hypothetical protein